MNTVTQTPSSAPRSGIDRRNEDGTPMAWNVRRFKENVAIIENPQHTMPSAIAKLRGPIDQIKQWFAEGKDKELMDVLLATGPNTFHAHGFGLADAQLLNDYAGLAVSCLLGEDAMRDHAYNYQSHLGQDSHDVALDRMAAAAGAFGPEAKASAIDEINRKNPEPKKVDIIQSAALEAIRALMVRK